MSDARDVNWWGDDNVTVPVRDDDGRVVRRKVPIGRIDINASAIRTVTTVITDQVDCPAWSRSGGRMTFVTGT